MRVGTNDAVDTEASVIVEKLLQLKCFVKEKLSNCKIVLCRPIRRAYNKVVTQLKELQIDMIGNEDITKKDFGKKCLNLSQHGLKKILD